jgi:hypothetical protein
VGWNRLTGSCVSEVVTRQRQGQNGKAGPPRKIGCELPTECPDCVELTAEHELLKRRYAMIVNRLFMIGYQFTSAEYRELKNSVEEARIQAEIAGARFKKHRFAVHSRVLAGTR